MWATIFPGHRIVGNLKVGDTESSQSQPWLTATARCALANLSARAGACAWMWRNTGRMIVGFDLDCDVNVFLGGSIRVGCIRKKRPALYPSSTAELSAYAVRTPFGLFAWVFRIIWNRECGMSRPSMVQLALNILCRQCSELACENISIPHPWGSRPKPA